MQKIISALINRQYGENKLEVKQFLFQVALALGNTKESAKEFADSQKSDSVVRSGKLVNPKNAIRKIRVSMAKLGATAKEYKAVRNSILELVTERNSKVLVGYMAIHGVTDVQKFVACWLIHELDKYMAYIDLEAVAKDLEVNVTEKDLSKYKEQSMLSCNGNWITGYNGLEPTGDAGFSLSGASFGETDISESLGSSTNCDMVIDSSW